MADRATRVQELSTTYFDILGQLNSTALPEWLQLDLTFQQMKVLCILRQNGPLKMRDLSEKLGVTMPTITGIVNRLIERKDGEAMLSRSVSPEDRRQVWAHLTEAGREATEMLNKGNITLLANALTQLSEADLESMYAPLRRLFDAIKDQQSAASAEPAPVIPLPLEETNIGLDLLAQVESEARPKETTEILSAK